MSLPSIKSFNNARKKPVVGCIFDEMAKRQVGFQKLRKLSELENFDLKELDLNSDLESHGPFSLIIYRSRYLADLAAELKVDKSGEAAKLYRKFSDFVKNQPEEMIFLDPVSAVLAVSNREHFCRILADMAMETKLFQIPNFLVLDSRRPADEMKEILRKSDLRYPIFAKPILSYHHNLLLILDENGLGCISTMEHPVLLQEFVSHDGVLHKIGVIGKHVHISPRASIRNLPSKSIESSHGIKISTEVVNNTVAFSELNSSKEETSQAMEIDRKTVKEIVDRIRGTFNLSLFGVDIIVESKTGRHFIIDVNYFPSYQLMDGVPEKIVEHIRSELGLSRAFYRSKL